MIGLAFDHRRVRAASRRAGQRFTLTAPRRPTPNGRYHAKLTVAAVAQIRQWAGRDGWGLPRRAQARALVPTFPWVSAQTLYDVLANTSWFDPRYDPARPDAAFWRGVTPLRVVLRVLR